jgi:hypothetical protein
VNPMGVVVCAAGIPEHKDHLSRLAVKLRGKAILTLAIPHSEYPTFYAIRTAIPAINQ